MSRDSQPGRAWLGCEPRWAHRRLKTGVCPRPPSREGRGWDLNPDGLPSHKHPSCRPVLPPRQPPKAVSVTGAAPGHPAALCAHTVASRHHPRPGATPDHHTSLEGRASPGKGETQASSEGCGPEAMLSTGRGAPKQLQPASGCPRVSTPHRGGELPHLGTVHQDLPGPFTANPMARASPSLSCGRKA